MGCANSKVVTRKTPDKPNRNQNEVLKVLFSFSFSAENRKNAVSKPKVRRMLTKETMAYRLVNWANSSVSMNLMYNGLRMNMIILGKIAPIP